MTKQCSKCKIIKELNNFHKDKTKKDNLSCSCKECRKNYDLRNMERLHEYQRKRRREHSEKIRKNKREWNQNNPEKIQQYRWKWRYGIKPEKVDFLLKNQENKCAICNKFFIKTPCIDHNHKTKVIRGLLCKFCNGRLGWYENRKEIINNYLGINQ